MLKDYLKKKKISIYSLSKKTNIPYSTLNDLCNGKVEIDNCKVNLLMCLATTLNISAEKLYDICKSKDNTINISKYNKQATIKVKNKKYYVECPNDNDLLNIEIFKVNQANTRFVKDAAQWLVEDKLAEKEMEETYALQFNEKR